MKHAQGWSAAYELTGWSRTRGQLKHTVSLEGRRERKREMERRFSPPVEGPSLALEEQ